MPQAVSAKDYSVLGYARVSTDHEDQDGSIAGQIDQLKAAGCTHIISERGSAFKENSRRRGWDELQGLVVSGQVKKFVAISLSRLSRKGEASDFLKICVRCGVDVHFLDGTPGDVGDPTAKLFSGVMDTINEVDSMIKSINIKNGLKRKFDKGDYACGSVPFGYLYKSPGVIPHPVEFAQAKRLWERLVAEEYSPARVIRKFKYKWTPEGMRKWMHNPMLRGYVKKEANKTTALITEAQYQKAKIALTHRNWVKAKSPETIRLFSTAVHCQCCGRALSYAFHRGVARLKSQSDVNCKFYGRGVAESRIKEQFIEALRDKVSIAVDACNSSPEELTPTPEQIQTQNQLDNLLGLQAQGVPDLDDAINRLRDTVFLESTRTLPADWGGFKDIILQPGALESLTDKELRELVLEFASDILYVGDPKRVEVRLRDHSGG